MIDTLNYTYGKVALILLIIVLFGIFVGADIRGTETNDFFKNSLDFSTYAANMYNSDLFQVSTNELYAKEYFIKTFSEMTNTTPSGNCFIPQGNNYPGPIELLSFRTVSPGQTIPYGTAIRPGYLAVIKVPLFGGNVPVVGPQYITVDMTYFSATTPIEARR